MKLLNDPFVEFYSNHYEITRNFNSLYWQFRKAFYLRFGHPIRHPHYLWGKIYALKHNSVHHSQGTFLQTFPAILQPICEVFDHNWIIIPDYHVKFKGCKRCSAQAAVEFKLKRTWYGLCWTVKRSLKLLLL